MYWTDWEEDAKESKRGRIERAWMDGSNRNVFLSSKTVLWPNGLSLDIPQGILYWVDAYYDRIEMVYLNSSERKVSTGSPSPGVVLREGTTVHSGRGGRGIWQGLPSWEGANEERGFTAVKACVWSRTAGSCPF